MNLQISKRIYGKRARGHNTFWNFSHSLKMFKEKTFTQTIYTIMKLWIMKREKMTINITIMKRIKKKKRASGQNTSRNHPYSLEMSKQPFQLNI